MVDAKPNDLASIKTQAEQIFSDIQAKGVNVADKKEIVKHAKSLLVLLDSLQPHINTAQSAFGNQTGVMNASNELRNKLNRIVAAYS